MEFALSPIVSFIIGRSKELASKMYSDKLCPEHIAICMLSHKSTILTAMADKYNVASEKVIKDLMRNVSDSNAFRVTKAEDVEYSAATQRILQQTLAQAHADGEPFVVKEEHLLMALLNRRVSNTAQTILNNYNLTYDALQAFVTNRHSTRAAASDDDTLLDGGRSGGSRQGAPRTTQQKGEEQRVVEAFSVDLTKAAREGLLDPVVGRDKEIERITEILCRRRKNNPVIIGEPGVGKSAIVEGLAQMIADKKTSPMLHDKRLLMLDMTLLVAGTKYRGQFEERLKRLLQEIEEDKNIIVFIDEIHTIIGAGDVHNGMDAANIMKPALARGTIQCIGATTQSEYAKTIEKDGALERRFQKVLVEPPTADETIEILRNLAGRYEQYHNVRYSDAALRACVLLTGRYITDRQFPDKAIDAMDEVGAKMRLRHNGLSPDIVELQKQVKNADVQKREAVAAQNFELAAAYRDRQSTLNNELSVRIKEWQAQQGNDPTVVEEDDVAATIAVMTGIPVQRIALSEQQRLSDMAQRIEEKVIAQDKAVEKVVKAIQRNRVGLRTGSHPIGVFLFLGPTGVGKTHLAKQLAIEMFGSEEALVRIDMSEYTESFNTSRLIGAPPGYVGYDEGGQLTERVRRHPYSIVLLDEIEKAHSNVYNMLLQVLDDGILTDGNGRKVDFRNTIIIMTSNTGTRQLKEFGRGIGFAATVSANEETSESHNEYARGVIQKALAKQFAPEFLNRLDEIITFAQLDKDAINKIVDIELAQLFAHMASQGYTFTITAAAKQYVADKGFDIQNGARPLKRSIQVNVEDVVCEAILSGKVHPGDSATIDKDDSSGTLVVTL